MNRRDSVAALLAMGIALPAAHAQPTGKVRRIGYLSAPTRASVEGVVQAFLRALRELGWVEGQNLIIEYRWAEGKIERLPELAAELVRSNVELIVAPANTAAVAAKAATSSIPIVMIFPVDPVSLGLVTSLSWPGGKHGRLHRPFGDLCRQDPERRQAGRPASGAADQVRTGHQPENRQGARPLDFEGCAAAGGRGD